VESGRYGDDREGRAGAGEVGTARVGLGSGVIVRLGWGVETGGFGSSVEEQCLDLLEIDDLRLLD
jgi:hypothetical protein